VLNCHQSLHNWEKYMCLFLCVFWISWIRYFSKYVTFFASSLSKLCCNNSQVDVAPV
jgi:hypothetical protein